MVATTVRLSVRAISLTTLVAVLLTACAARPGDPFRPDVSEPDQQAGIRDEPRDSGDVVDGLQREALQHQAAGEWEAAAALLERALRIDASSAELYRHIADVRLGQERFIEAEQVAAKGLSFAAGQPELEAALWRATAQARSGQGDTRGAREARERACSLGYC